MHCFDPNLTFASFNDGIRRMAMDEAGAVVIPRLVYNAEELDPSIVTNRSSRKLFALLVALTNAPTH